MARRNHQWDPSAARYRDPSTGRYIARATVRRFVDDLVRASQAEITRASELLREGTITTSEWNAIMRTEIKRTHLGTEALLRGGWKNMDARAYGRVGARVKRQYKFLDGFLSEIESGKVRPDGRLMARARMYAASARIAFQNDLTTMLDDLGYTEERNRLHPAEHCGQCVDMSALGWVPIGTLIPIGERECITNDQCDMVYR